MAMIAIPVSDDVGALFRQVEVPGERDESDHITLFYLGDEIKLDQIIKAIKIIFNYISNIHPFNVSCKRITTFPKGEKGYPVIAKLESKELAEFRAGLAEALKSGGVAYDEKFEEFMPHVTLAYSKKKPGNITFPKVEWQINSVCLHGGDSGDERIYTKFPFSLDISKKAGKIYRMASLYSLINKNI